MAIGVRDVLGPLVDRLERATGDRNDLLQRQTERTRIAHMRDLRLGQALPGLAGDERDGHLVPWWWAVESVCFSLGYASTIAPYFILQGPFLTCGKT